MRLPRVAKYCEMLPNVILLAVLGGIWRCVLHGVSAMAWGIRDGVHEVSAHP